VGCLLGTYVVIQKEEGQSVKALHFNFLGRRADYPSIHFTQLLQDQEKRIYDKFPEVDYFTLCVLPDNQHALKIYKELGFFDSEPVEKGFKGVSLLFFRKKAHQKEMTNNLSYIEVSTAVKKSRIEALGPSWAKFYKLIQ
jgi:hypothetical protein